MTTLTSRIRQSGLIPEEILEKSITIVGCGAIGSFTALALAKVGFHNIVAYDFDLVEEHNIPNQFYPLSAVGSPKVEALREMIKGFENVEIVTERMAWNGTPFETDVVISAVDSMSMRKEIWEGVKSSPSVRLFVDGRMGGNQFEVYTVNMELSNDCRIYASTLWSDEETEQIPCTQKSVIYNVLSIASWIVNQVRLVLCLKEYKRRIIMDLENMNLICPEE